MSTINQIQLPNGSTYDFEDTAAREEASSKADKTLATTSANGLMSAADKKAIDREFFRMVPKGGTYIPENADLNSIEYIKVGNYYNTFDRESKTIKNIPVIQSPYKAFMMYVLSPLLEVYDNESTDQWVYRLRIFVTYTGDDIFVQKVDSGATAGRFNYGPWVKMTNSNDLGAVSNTINTHIAKKSNPHKVTKDQVGLGSVANLDQSKAIKSITRSGTTFTATALDGTTTTFTQQDSSTTYSVATSSADGLMSKEDKAKLDGISSGAGSNVKSVNGKTGAVTISKADVGLDNVDNTSDADKPYYKLIGQTTNADQIGHFNFNDASRSLYKIKNFYAASGEGVYFYLAHKKSDYTITATKHFSNTAGLFTADLSDDCIIATNLISESDPAILTIVRKNEFSKAEDLTLIFYEDRGQQSNARLKHWKLETMVFTGKGWEWLTVFERTNVSDSINCLWCGLNPKDNWAYVRMKGIRITIYAATPCSTMSYAFGYNQLRIAGMRLLDPRPSFSPAEALGALDVAGGTVYGETTFQEGISATSYSGATATSSADGLMSKDDKAQLDTLEERVNSLNLSLANNVPANSAWAHGRLDGTTVNLMFSHNVESITTSDGHTFYVKFSTPFPDEYYAAVGSFEIGGNGQEIVGVYGYGTAGFSIDVQNASGNASNPSTISVIALR